MAKAPGMPSLDDFIASAHRQSACDVCARVPEDARAQIQAKIDAGVVAWAAFSRWLKASGYGEFTPAKLKRHAEQKHDA